jgi:uncharacterized membrane protein
MGVLLGLHVLGAIFMVGGISAQVLIRLQVGAAAAASEGLLALARRVQLAMVSSGSVLVLVSGIVLWVTERIKFLTGWLLLGLLLYIAAAALDGAFLSPNLRRLHEAARSGTAPAAADASGTVVEITAWALLIVVVFLMTARPF